VFKTALKCDIGQNVSFTASVKRDYLFTENPSRNERESDVRIVIHRQLTSVPVLTVMLFSLADNTFQLVMTITAKDDNPVGYPLSEFEAARIDVVSGRIFIATTLPTGWRLKVRPFGLMVRKHQLSLVGKRTWRAW